MLQDIVALDNINQRYKRIDYEYDLISGNAKAIHYQDGQPDQYHHYFAFDADNRITNVYTSMISSTSEKSLMVSAQTGLTDQDGKYEYYQHGPLARVEIGDLKVQAMDYAYTIQGWIKGVNSNALDSIRDIGKDAALTTGNLNRYVGKDAYGFSLSYFENDYKAISNPSTTDNFIASVTAAAYLQADAPDLFNGNISHMVTSITDPNGNKLPQLTAYKYDQLNRIKQMKAYRDLNLTTNEWANGGTYDGSYEEHYTYNANGSILTLERNGLASISGGAMDDITNVYETKANGYDKNTNKLRQRQDAVSSGTYSDDIDQQVTNNYAYDEIGNLLKDTFECIQNIEWTVHGKPKKVTRYPGCTTEGSPMPDLEFSYDASGNMTAKIVKPYNHLTDTAYWTITYYIYNAGGSMMATYVKKPTDEGGNFVLEEQQLYGSSHIGTYKANLDMGASIDSICTRLLGKKQFFLSDHRGNNNVTVLDQVKAINSGTLIVYFEPIVDRAVDYFPFGREQNGRIFSKDESEFGYNGKQKIKEWSARLGSIQNYGSRIKSGENFLSVDPLQKKYPHLSPYSFCANNPIIFVDEKGEEPITAIIDAITAFAIEAGMSFTENYLLKDMSAEDAFENIEWGNAAVEGLKSYAVSLVFTGVGSVKAIEKAANSKVGKVTVEIVANFTAELTKAYNAGELSTDGVLDFDKVQAVAEDKFQGAVIEALVSQGFSKKAQELEKKAGKNVKELEKQEKKLAENIKSKAENKGATEKTIVKREKKVDAAQKEIVKTHAKTAANTAASETTGKAASKANDYRKETKKYSF